MTDITLPTPNGDTGVWGSKLNAAVSTVRDVADAAHVLSSETATAGFTVSAGTSDVIEVDSATSVTVTLPAGLPGRAIEVYQAGAGSVSVAGASGVAVRVAPPSTGLRTPGRYGSISVRSRGGTAVTTAPATGLVMRFRADDLAGSNGSAVSSWAESSGAGHPAAVQATGGNQPTVATNSGGTGHKGVSFNGTSSFLTLSGSALAVAQNKAALTVFAAVAFTSPVTTGTRTLFALSTGTSSTSSRVLLGHRDSVSGLPIAGGRRLDANSLASTTGTSIPTVQNVILGARYLWSTSDVYLYQNGTQTGSNTSFQTDGNTDNTASLAGVIGANLAGTGEWFQGHLLELLVYADPDTSGTLRSSVDSYFLGRYGLTAADGVTAEWIASGGVA